MTALLTVDNLSHRYNADNAGMALSFGSFALNSGELLLVRGPSGCGKSTLLHLLGGVLPLGSGAGAATVDGRAMAALSGAQRDALRPFVVGWMPQRHSMINSISVLDNVLLPVALARKVTAADRARAFDLLRALDVESLTARRPADVSVGQSARVNLARALVTQPKLLLADEPTAALDEASVSSVAAQLVTYVQSGGGAVVASHDTRLRERLFAALGARMIERDLAQ